MDFNNFRRKNISVTCPYCKKDAVWCENMQIYGKNFGESYMCYLCKDCDAYVGCHNNTREPLGTMADKKLREKRMQAHSILDPLWRRGKYKRSQIYKILSDHFGKSVHIGYSDFDMCEKIILYLNTYIQK